jgi:hypothetical protein
MGLTLGASGVIETEMIRLWKIEEPKATVLF